MLKWVDEFAWMAASKEYRGCKLVTVAMNEIRFAEQVPNGAILRFNIEFSHQRKTSVTYDVTVFSDAPGASQEKMVFANKITFVRVDALGYKTSLPLREEIAAWPDDE